MKILVIIRQVPDTSLPLRIQEDHSSIAQSSVSWVCNPFDEFALEAAARLAESRIDTEGFTALAIGNDRAKELLYTAVAVGATDSIHLAGDNSAGFDELDLARQVASIIRDKQFDLILCGRLSIDSGSDILGPAIAEHLGLPCIPAAIQLAFPDTGKRLTARYKMDTQSFEADCPLPAVVTCDKGLAELRIPPLKKILAARKKPVERFASDQAPSATLPSTLAPPPTRPPCRLLEGNMEEMAGELSQYIRKEY